MMSREGFVLTSLFAAAGCAVPEDADTIATTAQPVTLSERIAQCSADRRVSIGILSLSSCVGGDLFLREAFNGNGRSCATCHPVARNFAIDPAFIAGLPPGDPLFIAENNPQLAGLEIPRMMREFGLILENVDGFSPDPTVRFVLRSVPHTLSLGTSVLNPPNTVSPPVNRTGWSGDGAPGDGSLRQFQNGAITQHYTKSLARVAGTDFRLAVPGELDAIDHFMRRLGRLNELNLAGVVMKDAGAEAGRARFLSVGCNACHGNGGANASFGGGGNRNFNTGVEAARNAALAAFPFDGGFGLAQVNGAFGDGTFNTPPVIEAADTGPFFHTATTVSGASAHNAAMASTIEQAIAFYDTPAFNNSPSGRVGPINLTAVEIDNIGRFLRGLNASFNIAIASRRLEAVGDLLNNFIHDEGDLRGGLLRLAGVEIRDALRMLSEVPNLNPIAKNALSDFIRLVPAFDEPNPCGGLTAGDEDVDLFCGGDDRDSRLNHLRDLLATALANIGTNLTYQIGDAVLMF
jgi:mono/diheme cytochrome c family protein